MKYKVGDKVKIREDLVVDKEYGSQVFVDSMEKYKGKIVTINRVIIEDGYNKECYMINEYPWCWTDEMLEDTVNVKEDIIDVKEDNENIECDNENIKCKENLYLSIGYNTIYSGHQVLEKVILINNPSVKNNESKFVFLDENGNMFVLTLKDIIYIIPYEHKRKEK
jgi:hypothetical protein